MRYAKRAVLFLLLAAAACLALAAPAAAASTFTVTLPAGTEVTMGDPSSVLPFTVSNTGTKGDIREIEFKADTNLYEFSTATVPPPGWCIDKLDVDKIKFRLVQPDGSCDNNATGSEIVPGASLDFSITILPLADAADVTTDTLKEVKVKKDKNFNLSGGLPTWTRRSLAASITATPASVGVGDSITVTMDIANRSTATHTGITSTPAPPSPSNPLVTLTEGPYYGSTVLGAGATASDTVITVASTSEFPSSGTIKIDSEEICYTGTTATTFTGLTRGCNSTTAASHTVGATTWGLVPFTMASGGSGVATWIFSADLAGSVSFSARATNSSGTAKSVLRSSNTVIIGDFTASLSVSPTSVITGQTTTVTMTVKNNGTSALINVAPSTLLACAGGATETLAAGPTPALISSLAAGATGTFTWTYTITGSVGDAYCFSGTATADGPVSTNTASSNSGTVSNYSATVAPAVVASGSTNQTLTWTVYNGGGCPIKEVKITTPVAGADWNCGSVSPPAGWTASCKDKVKFKSGGGSSDIPSGGTKSFGITFSTTETVTADKVVNFPLELKPNGCGGDKVFLGTFVTVTANALALTHSPAGPIFADGSSTYTMTATLTNGGTPVAGKTVTFSTTGGTLSSTTATTDTNGEATVTLTAPVSSTDTSAVVTATYLTAQATDTVDFTGWTGANLQYWGALTPTTVNCGSTYSITMNVRNVSATSSMSLTTASFFAFNDSSAGGTAVFQAYLDSATTVPASTTVSLTFGSATSAGGGGGVAVDSNFTAGSYLPTQNSSPPPESGLFLTDGVGGDQRRSVTDQVTVSGSCGAVKVDVIDWHEIW